jgi:hypothetical protein
MPAHGDGNVYAEFNAKLHADSHGEPYAHPDSKQEPNGDVGAMSTDADAYKDANHYTNVDGD